MAFTLLRVLVLGVIAAAADDDVNITWAQAPRAALPCVVADAGRVHWRRPLPLNEETSNTSPVIWWRGSQEIAPKWIFPNGTLEVFRKDDGSSEGEYQCGVRHQGSVVLGYPVHLKFAYIDEQFFVYPENVIVSSGQPLVLTCGVNSAPAANVTWQKDGVSLSGDDIRHYTIDNQLLILDVRNEDAGLYRCTASNWYVNVSKRHTSQASRLHVALEPVQVEPGLLRLNQTTDVLAARGSRVVLACPVTGWPRPKLLWELTPPGGGRTGELEATDEVLVLSNLELDQEGVYTCKIEGYRDLFKKTFNVTIPEPPVITHGPADREVLRASTVRLNCSATGKPRPRVAWYKNGTLINIHTGRMRTLYNTNDRRLQLVIGGVTSDDAGVYQCFASSPAGVASSWAVLNVTGAGVAAPHDVLCHPVSDRTVLLQWAAVGSGVIYTVHVTRLAPGEITKVGEPFINTKELLTVEESLTPYKFQVRTYLYGHTIRTAASDLSEGVICQGQGVPITLMKLSNGSVLVSWEEFASRNPDVVEWMLQFRVNEDASEHNVTLPADVHRYTLSSSDKDTLNVRVLGTKSEEWLQQDLSKVPWTVSGPEVNSSPGPVPVPADVAVSQVGPYGFTVNWTCRGADSYSYRVCVRRLQPDGAPKCQERYSPWAAVGGLEPGAPYEVSVRAAPPGRAPGPPAALYVTTAPDTANRLTGLQYSFVGPSALRVSWAAAPNVYRVHYSAELVLPVENWASVNTTGNSVLINGIKPYESTFVLVMGDDPPINSQILTIPPQVQDLEPSYSYTAGGVRLWWRRAGARSVRYTQHLGLARPVDLWPLLNVTGDSVEITGLNESLHTYVLVGPAAGDPSKSRTVLNIPPRPRPPQDASLYVGVAVGCGVLILLALLTMALLIWRRRKMARSPFRFRRRSVRSANAANDGERSEMKHVGNRLANGGGSKDVGEPLLNGHVHITENPQPKTPNGKMKKAHRYGYAFDVSRCGEPDADPGLQLGPGTPPHPGPGTPPRPDTPPHTPGDPDTRRAHNKLPDDNMNSELNSSSPVVRDNSKIQPTLQPNG